jgi:hypothetical protein
LAATNKHDGANHTSHRTLTRAERGRGPVKVTVRKKRRNKGNATSV